VADLRFLGWIGSRTAFETSSTDWPVGGCPKGYLERREYHQLCLASKNLLLLELLHRQREDVETKTPGWALAPILAKKYLSGSPRQARGTGEYQQD
jgi:hypothetical protein